MKTLDEIKEEVARDKGFKDWNALFTATGTTYLEYRMNEVAKRYAIAYGQALLQKASEEATIIINEYRLVKGKADARFFPFKIGNTYSINDGCFIEIDKDSILNVTLKLI